MKTNKLFKAYIASNEHTSAFDHAYSEKSPSAAISAVKRRNSPDWKDCHIWCVEIIDGQETELN